jgi:hypothetical protein
MRTSSGSPLIASVAGPQGDSADETDEEKRKRKAQGMKKGGSVSASKRADGCCTKGKTKGRMV